MKILAVSDVELNFIYNAGVKKRFGDVDMVIGCGDLPYYYMEYIISMLDRPLYYVRGNHAPRFQEEGVGGSRTHPWGGIDLHRRAARDTSGLLLAGIEGSVRYNMGRYQYTQGQMWRMVFGLVPKLLLNRVRFGRYLDIFVTHAPPWQIHDDTDLPHQGIKAFRWLIRVFCPAYHLHGHIHIYNPQTTIRTQFGQTQVVNTYGYQILEIKG